MITDNFNGILTGKLSTYQEDAERLRRLRREADTEADRLDRMRYETIRYDPHFTYSQNRILREYEMVKSRFLQFAEIEINKLLSGSVTNEAQTYRISVPSFPYEDDRVDFETFEIEIRSRKTQISRTPVMRPNTDVFHMPKQNKDGLFKEEDFEI